MSISTCRKVFLTLLTLVVACAACTADAAGEGRYGDNLIGLPSLSAFQLYQIGDADLVINISGKRLPPPEIVNSGSDTLVILREARWDEGDRTINPVPMVTRISAEQRGRDVIVAIRTEKPLQLQSTRGIAPSDAYTLRLTTMDQQQKLIEEPVATRQPQTLRVPTGPFAVTTPITLDLRDAELKDVFRMLGAHLKKNIIIDPSLPPALVTMTLKNTPLSEAFGYLMRTYDIAYELAGKDTIIVGTTDGLSKVAGKEETRAYHVAYADPAALSALVVNLTKVTADRVVVDPRLRTLYVTSYPSKLEEVALVLQKLDHPGKQIMLHARILEFTDNATLEVESALNAVYDHWWFNYAGGQATGGFADDNRLGRGTPTSTIQPGTGLLTPMQGVWREFDVAFRAVETKGWGRALANPSVIVIDGQEANISLTQDYPYISGRDDAGNPSWSIQRVGPQMTLTPTLGRDGIVTIKLTIQTGDIVDQVSGSLGETMPITANRSVETNVRVRDGEPFVVGGLFNDNKTRSKMRIPILGQIPLLGEIFTVHNNTHRKTQVAIVVVPYILNTPDVAIDQERVLSIQ
ncbi:MAG: type II and III secretion system protein [Synergistaceae bacterium]|jgi:type IV pilus assembly protein PilQ|nr:type II and III secretion system protein [Synergistaceae bacterium]